MNKTTATTLGVNFNFHWYLINYEQGNKNGGQLTKIEYPGQVIYSSRRHFIY